MGGREGGREGSTDFTFSMNRLHLLGREGEGREGEGREGEGREGEGREGGWTYE